MLAATAVLLVPGHDDPRIVALIAPLATLAGLGIIIAYRAAAAPTELTITATEVTSTCFGTSSTFRIAGHRYRAGHPHASGIRVECHAGGGIGAHAITDCYLPWEDKMCLVALLNQLAASAPTSEPATDCRG